VFAVSIGYGALRVVGGCEPFGPPAALSNAQGEWARRLCAVWAMHALGARYVAMVLLINRGASPQESTDGNSYSNLATSECTST
jgi:hypothetical protein